jgi:TonB family protein
MISIRWILRNALCPIFSVLVASCAATAYAETAEGCTEAKVPRATLEPRQPAAQGTERASSGLGGSVTTTVPISASDWCKAPTGDDVGRYYPSSAERLGLGGTVTLSCQVTAKGFLEGCSAASEDPTDQGFGSAALRMSRLFKMCAQTKDGTPTEGGRVTLPVIFLHPKGVNPK